MPTNIGSLAYEHSKQVSPSSSLTSIMLLDDDSSNETHRILNQGINVHMRSFSSQVYSFESSNEIIKNSWPVLDFMKLSSSPFQYQIPILARLRKEISDLMMKLNELQSVEDIKAKYGMNSDPWDKYLLLDSKFFVRFLCQSEPMEFIQLVFFVEFAIYSLKNELISMFKIDMAELRTELLKHVNKFSEAVVAQLLKDPLGVDVDWALQEIDEKFIKKFYVDAKMQGWLKDFKDDYDDLLSTKSSSEVSTLKTEVKDQGSSRSQKLFEKIAGLKD